MMSKKLKKTNKLGPYAGRSRPLGPYAGQPRPLRLYSSTRVYRPAHHMQATCHHMQANQAICRPHAESGYMQATCRPIRPYAGHMQANSLSPGPRNYYTVYPCYNELFVIESDKG